jgi:maltooligosyltrehalose trehalohydrolase
VWSDDFHHTVRRHLAGDDEAWFADFRGSTDEIAAAVRDGWVFTGQHAAHYEGPRGTSPAGVPIEASVICLQNHDQVGNRAHGDRLHHQVDTGAWLAASTLLLTAPETPMLFMGQEWAASSPFLFFTDHEAGLGDLVIEGRRREFVRFSSFGDPAARERIPSPQAERTWRTSVLSWEERNEQPHAHVLAQTSALLAIRRAHLSAPRDRARIMCEAAGPHGVILGQPSARGGYLLTVIDFFGTGARTCAVAAAHSGQQLHVLHATSPAADKTVVHDVRMAAGQIAIEASPEPYGLVLHLAEVTP